MGNQAIAFLLPGQKGLQVLGDNPIKWIIFRISRTVCRFGITDEATFILCITAVAGQGNLCN